MCSGHTVNLNIKREGGRAMASDTYGLICDIKKSPIAEIIVRDFQHYVTGMTGQKLHSIKNINSVDEDVDLTFVFTTGYSPAVSQLLSEGKRKVLKGLKEESFLIKSLAYKQHKIIVFLGIDERGAMHAMYYFLEKHCGIGFFSDGDKIPHLTKPLLGKIDIVQEPVFKYRGFFTHPYWSAPYAHCSRLWTFEDWKKEIDYIRKKRFNIFNPVHDEGTFLWGDVVFKAFPELNKLKNEEKFTMGLADRTKLMKKVINYARNSGIYVSYNVFYSQVPYFFKDAYPELKYHPLHMDSLGICASQPECKTIMHKLWSGILKTFGLDESHIYFLCPYQHEEPLCQSFETRAEVSVQACQLLKELDPQAEIYVETWDFHWDQQEQKEWAAFLDIVPEDIKVVDWDSNLGERLNWFKPRTFMRLFHPSMESTYPPDFICRLPQDVSQLIKDNAANGAIGYLCFNIIANSNEYLCDLSAELCWDQNLNEMQFREDFCKRRFSQDSARNLMESLNHYIESIHVATVLNTAYAALVGEHEIVNRSQLPDFKEWANQRIEQYKAKSKQISKALEFADLEKTKLEKDAFYQKYYGVLEFVKYRWDGIINFLNLYLDPNHRDEYIRHILGAFQNIVDLYRDKDEFSMESVTKFNPGLRKEFVEDWRNQKSGHWNEVLPHVSIIWEDFPLYEKALKKLIEAARN